MGGGSGDSWGGRAESEAGKWAGVQPEGPLMHKKVFGLFLKGGELLKRFFSRERSD